MTEELPSAPGLAPDAAELPGPRKSRSRRWLLLGAVVVLAGGAGATAFALTGGSPPPPATYRIATPHSAGEWRISNGPSNLSPADLSDSEIQRMAGGLAKNAVTAFYTRTSPSTVVIFHGATGPLGDPAGLINRLHANPNLISEIPGASVTWREVAPGPHGGRAACGDVTSSGVLPVTIPFCVWQTTTSLGQFVQLPSPGIESGALSPDDLGAVMRSLRGDLEAAG